jgi:hypothetical protein
VDKRGNSFGLPFRFPSQPRDVVRRRGIPVPLRILLFMLIPHVWIGMGMIYTFVQPLFGGMPQVSFNPGILFALFWNGILGFGFYGLCLSPLSQRRLLTTGDVAGGVIAGKEVHKGRSTTYSVLYTFNTPDGAAHRGTMNVTQAEYDWAKPGDEVAVFYNPNLTSRSLVYKYSQYAVRDEHGFPVNG